MIGYDGSVFTGNFEKGCKHGQGNWTIPIMEESKRRGRTITLLGDVAEEQGQAVYSGSIEKGMLCGNGSETWSTGVEYKGDFLNNKRHGRGRMLQRDGTVYEGQWSNGTATGYGTLI